LYGRRDLILRAFLRMLPALTFGVVFVGGVYTLLALEDHSWWKPLIYIVAVPLVARFVSRSWRRWHPRPTDRGVDDADDADVAAISEERPKLTSRQP
jgi:hypothetical protein